MTWTMAAVKAPASAVKTPLDQIPADVQESIEEAFAYCQANPTERLVVPFESVEAQEENRALIRSYCEARPKGRLTASIWAGYAGTETVDGTEVTRFSQVATEVCTTPALSLFLSVYVKKAKGVNSAPANGQAQDGES